MSKKKKCYPKDMEELMEITYGTDYNKKKKYNDAIISDIYAPLREKQVINSVKPSLNIEKITEIDGVKTPDFIIKSKGAVKINADSLRPLGFIARHEVYIATRKAID